MSRYREVLGGQCSQGSRTKEVQYFQQFKLIDLCVSEIRKRREEFFAFDEVPRGIEEAMAMCERELEERIRSMRMLIGASTLLRDLEVAGDSCKRAGDVRRWKKAVSEAMEERIRRRNLSVEQDRERRRLDGLFTEGIKRREVSKDGRSKTVELRMCYGCGQRGHLKKTCKGERKR